MDPATFPPRLEPRVEFARRLEQARLEAAKVARLDDIASNVRLGLAVVAVTLGILAFRGGASWLLVGSAVALFVPLVMAHGRVMTRRRRAERVAAFHEKGIARVEGRWAGAGSTGLRFLDEEHPYAADLDLFGVGSLFERLCAARTAGGEATLASWLLHPAQPGEVASRHEAVREIRDKLDFREDLALLGDDVRTDVRADTLAEWGASPRKSVPVRHPRCCPAPGPDDHRRAGGDLVRTGQPLAGLEPCWRPRWWWRTPSRGGPGGRSMGSRTARPNSTRWPT